MINSYFFKRQIKLDLIQDVCLVKYHFFFEILLLKNYVYKKPKRDQEVQGPRSSKEHISSARADRMKKEPPNPLETRALTNSFMHGRSQ